MRATACVHGTFPLSRLTYQWNESSLGAIGRFHRGEYDAGSHRSRDAAYGMIVNLSLEELQAAREKVSSHLAERPNASEQELAVEGLRYLRSVKDLA